MVIKNGVTNAIVSNLTPEKQKKTTKNLLCKYRRRFGKTKSWEKLLASVISMPKK